MKVLIVSSIPWTSSNRGIDILCSALAEEGHDVTHLVFPVYGKLKKINSFSNKIIKQLYAENTYIPYDDDTMYWLPKFAMRIIHDSHIKSVRDFNFSEYDIIVLESGKPVFLIDLIPRNVKLIYRQSDPVWMLMKSDYLKELENKVIAKCDMVLVVRKVFMEYIPQKFWGKTYVWQNGFNVPKLDELINPYDNKRRKAVYLGFTRIDYHTLNYVSLYHPDVEFHIIGNRCLSNFEIKKLIKRDNIFIHGYMKPTEYLPYIKYADFAIIPYKKDIKAMTFIGLSSKYLLFMYFGLPIVSYRPGIREEFANIPVFFADDIYEFSNQISKVKEMGKINYNIDFNYYSYNGRKMELLRILKSNGFL